ncbi:integrase, catalytic region, zinc finger, CCHC-type containing protein [Tanacetum coccineum]|uniref:Integrase, catalytic region, zinc finger, CCHC-type containing protein n=1 Tax=Tanacetum coccineum TaxID=301880 RepID=A0ABQ5EKX5_9ASTR
MLDKDLYNSWKSRMELYMQNREHGRMILESVEHGPLIWPTVEENGLPDNIYSLVNHHRVSKDLWERVQLLMQGTSLTKQERECKLYDAFDKFTHIKGGLLHTLPPEWSKFVTDVKLVKDLHTSNFDQLHAYLEQHELHANEVRIMRERHQDPLAFVSNQQMTPPHFNPYQSSFNNPQLQQQFSPSQRFSPSQYGSIQPNQQYSSHYPSQTQLNPSSIQPSHIFQFQINHQTSTVPQVIPQVAYQSPQATTQLMTKTLFVDSGFAVPVFSPGDDPIACLNKAMAFLTAVASSRFPTTNNQLRTSFNLRNQTTIQDGRVTVQQARVVKCYNCQGEGHMARQCTQPKRPRNAAWYKEKAMLVEAQEAGQILDEEQLTFLANLGIPASQAQKVIPHNAAFQTEDLDTYDFDCDDLSNAQAVLMANISNNGSDVISEVPNFKTYLNDMDNQSVLALQDFEQSPVMHFIDNEISSDSNIIPYSQYLQETQQATEKANKEQNIESITAELERYKERVKTFEQRLNIDLSSRKKMIDSQIDDMIREKLALNEQINSLEQNLSKQIKEKKSVLQTLAVFKNESKEKENKYMENEIDLENKTKELDNIICKVGQSAQTVHMLTKQQAFYDNTHKQALGYQNPCYLKKAQRIKPTLYDGVVISNTHVAMPVIDDEETLILEAESRSKMFEKAKDPEVVEKKISHKPIDYRNLNSLIDDFGKRFSPQQEYLSKQAFWFPMLNPTIEPSYTPPVIVDVPSKLPKVSLVNASLKKLKFHLTQFDSMVKKRTTPSALEEEIAKKEILLENDQLLQQIVSQDVMLTVKNSMSFNNDSVYMNLQKCDLCEMCLNINAELSKSKQTYSDLLKNHSQLEKHCISLELSMQLKQEVFQNDKSYVSQNTVEIPEYFVINDLKARLQDKDTTICKLNDTIKSLEKITKDKNVHHEKCDLEPINEEMENSVATLLSENEQLWNEINHVKQFFKDQFDVIKQTRVRHKEQCDSLINKLNLKSMENEDLKAQIQDKVFVITSLKNDLRKLKGKEIVKNASQIPSATTIAQSMFKLDLVPLPPSELDFACKYATRIQGLLVYVQDTCRNAITPSSKKIAVTPMNNVKKVRFAEPITSSSKTQQVESSKTSDSNTPVLSSTVVKCSTSNCGSKPPGNKKNDRISQKLSRNKKNNVEAQPKKVNKLNCIAKPICDVDVKHSLSNANSEILCASCNKSLFDVVHDKCLLDFVHKENSHSNSAKKHKKQNIWKPTGHVFNEVGYKWKPTGKTFTIVGNSCPLTSFTTTNVVPSKQTTSHSDEIQKPEIKVYSIKPKNVKNIGTVRFGNDQIARIMGYGDYQLGNVVISKLAKDSLARGIPRLKFQKDHLCSACSLGKSKTSSHQPKAEDTNQEKLYLLHMDLCGPMCVTSINGKRYILVIVDDYSRFTWVKFLKTKDEAPAAIIKCIKNIQVRLKATVWNVQTDNGTEFVNQTLREWYENVGITHQTSVARTPQQNGVVERRNRTLVEAARTMLIFSRAPLFIWAEAINTASNIGIFVGYAPAKKAFRIYNRRTRIITEIIHVTFDELTAMASEQFSSGPGLQYMTSATSSTGLVLIPVYRDNMWGIKLKKVVSPFNNSLNPGGQGNLGIKVRTDGLMWRSYE